MAIQIPIVWFFILAQLTAAGWIGILVCIIYHRHKQRAAGQGEGRGPAGDMNILFISGPFCNIDEKRFPTARRFLTYRAKNPRREKARAQNGS